MKVKLKCINENNRFHLDLTLNKIYDCYYLKNLGAYCVLSDYWEEKFHSVEELLKSNYSCYVLERCVNENFEVVEYEH